MALLAAYETTFPHFPLVDVAAALPNVALGVDVGQPNHAGLPRFTVRVTGGDRAAVADAFAASEFVDEFARVGQTGETDRYQVVPTRGMEAQLGDHVDDVDELRSLAGNASVVESITVTPTGWRQRRRFADREAFDQYRAFWMRNAEAFELLELSHDDGSGDGDGSYGLTDRQREALAVACELGYFEVPRTATLADVADELGVAPASASERLRRGQERLVDATVADELSRPHFKGRTTEPST